jgi:hypothetical protein
MSTLKHLVITAALYSFRPTLSVKGENVCPEVYEADKNELQGIKPADLSSSASPENCIYI